MKRRQGIHFYINIKNLNEIILNEEAKTKRVNHAIHAMDTFFSSIEAYGKKQYPDFLTVEKVTGSRLHMYVTADIVSAFNAVKTVSAYAYKVAGTMNRDIAKYNGLDNFQIHIGAASGRFYDYEFTTQDGYSELTTIGYAANFAAKLQSKASVNYLNISEDIYNVLSKNDQQLYQKVDDQSIEKYGQECYFTIHLSKVTSPVIIKSDDMEDVKKRANNLNLSDIDYAGVKKKLDFANLNRTQCKQLDGIPVFADVRDFTSQFKEDDSNLEEMAQTTQQILERMYRVSTEHGGIHVQFQGDRELSLYHNVPGETVNGVFKAGTTCFKDAVLASMRMIDAVKPYQVHIGIGEDFGRLFATKIGARDEKDNVLLGETVIVADQMEDRFAGADQIAITAEVYTGLKEQDAMLASKFEKSGGYFIATLGFAEYTRQLASIQQQKNTTTRNYNKAWGDLL